MVKEIDDLAKISLSHAYRIVKDSAIDLIDTVRELLTIKALGQIPGREIGWRFDARNRQMITPEGKLLHCADLRTTPSPRKRYGIGKPWRRTMMKPYVSNGNGFESLRTG